MTIDGPENVFPLIIDALEHRFAFTAPSNKRIRATSKQPIFSKKRAASEESARTSKRKKA